MKEIVKVLLAEGINEDTIHEVLDIISEVSVGSWSTSASSSLPKRKEKLESVKKDVDNIRKNLDLSNFKLGRNKYDYGAYEKAQNELSKKEEEVKKLEGKVKHAQDVVDLGLNKKSKVGANTLTKAVISSGPERSERNQRALRRSDKNEQMTALKRTRRASDIGFANPNRGKHIAKLKAKKEAVRSAIENASDNIRNKEKLEKLYNKKSVDEIIGGTEKEKMERARKAVKNVALNRISRIVGTEMNRNSIQNTYNKGDSEGANQEHNNAIMNQYGRSRENKNKLEISFKKRSRKNPIEKKRQSLERVFKKNGESPFESLMLKSTIKMLLQEGIGEEIIHEVLEAIHEK